MLETSGGGEINELENMAIGIFQTESQRKKERKTIRKSSIHDIRIPEKVAQNI